MTPAEAAALLLICAAYDYRKPDADAAKAWAMALDGLRFEDCRAAVVEHYQASTERIMPAHVRAAVKRAREGRIEDAVPIAIPPGFDPDDTAAYQQLLVEARTAQAEGREVPQPEPAPAAIEGRVSQLRSVLRSAPKSLPRAPVRPHEKSPEHKRRVESASAELEPYRARLAAAVLPPPTEADRARGKELMCHQCGCTRWYCLTKFDGECCDGCEHPDDDAVPTSKEGDE